MNRLVVFTFCGLMLVLIAAALGSCVDGQSGKIYVCPAERCKVP